MAQDLTKPALPAASAEQDGISGELPGPFEWCEIPEVEGYELIDDEGNSVAKFDIARFQMARYPITVDQYQVFLDAGDGYSGDEWWHGLAHHPIEKKAPVDKPGKHPCGNVSWFDAVAFCRWLSSQAGYEVRLPAEWEWQWAAQGPDGRAYPWGDKFEVTACNCYYSGYDGTTPVDMFPSGASPYGVMDLSGNSWEWCLNEYCNTAGIGIESKEERAIRGGSWRYLPNFLHSAGRFWAYPEGSRTDCGFRVARSL
jgi:formylglycine-generating enzyme required for sulfatase activity